MESEKPRIFTDEAIENFVAFGQILQRIHNRLISEGIDVRSLEKEKIHAPLRPTKKPPGI